MAMINFILTYNNLENIFEAISVKTNICETEFQSMQPIKLFEDLRELYKSRNTRKIARFLHQLKLRLSKSQITTNTGCVIHIEVPQKQIISK